MPTTPRSNQIDISQNSSIDADLQSIIDAIALTATEATITAINAKLPALISGRLPVDVEAIATQTVDGTVSVDNFPATQTVNGTVTANTGLTQPLTDAQLRATPVATTIPALPAGSNTIGSIANTAFGISGTLPAFAATPTFNVGTIAGISTEATLSTLNGKVPAGLTVSGTRLLVDSSGVTQPVNAASLPLPTGAATAANQSTLLTNTGAAADAAATSDTGTFGIIPLLKRLLSVTLTKGQQLMTASLPVAIASDQSKVDTKEVVEQISGFATSLTAPGVSSTIDSTPYNKIIIWYDITNIDTSVTIRVEGSGDGSTWVNLDALNEDTVITKNIAHYFILDRIPAYRVRFRFVSEAGGTNATIGLAATGS